MASDNPTTLISIPRDSYVPIPGHGRDKINAAFALGGGRLLTQTVELATGLHLDHYAEVGFSELAGVDLPAGCQTLDGRAALGYVRTRATPRADLEGSDVPVPAAAFETQP